MNLEPIPNQPPDPSDTRLQRLGKDAAHNQMDAKGREAEGDSPPSAISELDARDILAEDKMLFSRRDLEKNPFEVLIRRWMKRRRQADDDSKG